MDKNTAVEAAKESISNILETRKSMDALLRFKEQNILLKGIPGTSKKEIDASIWNEIGVYFLNNRMYLDASLIYKHMLRTILKVESEKKVLIHKGLPLHNIGVSQINMKNYDEGIPNILKAYEEDVETYGKSEADKKLANHVKEGLFNFISEVVDNNYLKEFNNLSGLSVKNTFSLMANMDDAEKLFFSKIVNSEKLMSFHNDVYTRVTMFDNLKNLGLLLESNLRRRSSRPETLPGLITNIFKKTPWEKYHEKNMKTLTHFDDKNAVVDFENKIDSIEKLKASGNSKIDFLVGNFLTVTLVRNFTAHYFDEKLSIFSDPKKYDRVFTREIFSILYSLAHKVT